MSTASHQDLFKSSIASLRVAGAHNNKDASAANLGSSIVAPISPPTSIKKADSVASSNDVSTAKGDEEISGGRECYDGNYKFAPIREHITARAMIKRHGEAMYESAISDVVIGASLLCFRGKNCSSRLLCDQTVGCGSAGLSCAYTIASRRPDLKVTIIEAGVAP